MTSPALEALARQALEGDRDALDRLLRSLQGDLYGLVLRMLWNREDAEDATQETLVRIVTRLSQFNFESRVKAWAYRVAVNYILDTKKSAVERLHGGFERFAATSWSWRALRPPRCSRSTLRCSASGCSSRASRCALFCVRYGSLPVQPSRPGVGRQRPGRCPAAPFRPPLNLVRGGASCGSPGGGSALGARGAPQQPTAGRIGGFRPTVADVPRPLPRGRRAASVLRLAKPPTRAARQFVGAGRADLAVPVLR